MLLAVSILVLLDCGLEDGNGWCMWRWAFQCASLSDRYYVC